jgi:hypothetical protein
MLGMEMDKMFKFCEDQQVAIENIGTGKVMKRYSVNNSNLYKVEYQYRGFIDRQWFSEDRISL